MYGKKYKTEIRYFVSYLEKIVLQKVPVPKLTFLEPFMTVLYEVELLNYIDHKAADDFEAFTEVSVKKPRVCVSFFYNHPSFSSNVDTSWELSSDVIKPIQGLCLYPAQSWDPLAI